VLGELGVAAAAPPSASTPVWFASTTFVTSERTGVFHAAVERGAWVGAGTLLGYVSDYFGDGRHEVRSPAAGVVLYVRSVPSVVEGGQVAFIGQVK
jgi:predicted deacylase